MNWDKFEDAASSGPWKLFKMAFWFIMATSVLSMAGMFVLNYFHQASDLASNEFGPKAIAHRYNWFKDTAAQLDARMASIKIYEKRFENLKIANDGLPRGKWSREDREQSNLWDQELSGIKASYNILAAEYNAAMAKVQWRFTNVGDVPAGGQPLPREFRSYQ